MASRKAGPSLEAAATFPEEHEFIAAIVSAPWDDSVKLVYADWLEERGDPRSSFLRELVAATRPLKKGTMLPVSGSLPQAWANMVGVPLLKGILEFDLVELKDTILRLARPIVTIATRPAKDVLVRVGGSKFGGRPDLPRSVDWPTCEKGPLGFLGQIALRDLEPTQVVRFLPKDGLLSFFAYQSYETGYQPGVAEGVAGDTRVLYTREPTTLERREPPDELDEEGNEILPACRLAFCETWDLPDMEDTLPRAYAADMEQLRKGNYGDRSWEVRGTCHSFGHHLLGYSVHSRRPSDPSPGPDWLHLLCLCSDDNLGWSWCDGEHLAVFVHEQDMRSASFARIYAYAS
jgi:uncharacterized protein (TIGR02996 family)